MEPTCDATTVFWDGEYDAECCLPFGHQPNTIHEDVMMGEWDEAVYATERGVQ